MSMPAFSDEHVLFTHGIDLSKTHRVNNDHNNNYYSNYKMRTDESMCKNAHATSESMYPDKNGNKKV